MVANNIAALIAGKQLSDYEVVKANIIFMSLGKKAAFGVLNVPLPGMVTDLMARTLKCGNLFAEKMSYSFNLGLWFDKS